MKKRFTLLSTALLAVSLSAGAADNTEWKEGYYYQLESNGYYLAVDGVVSDSVIVKKNYCRIKGFVGFNIVANNKAYNFWRNCLSIPK